MPPSHHRTNILINYGVGFRWRRRLSISGFPNVGSDAEEEIPRKVVKPW
jgi:hypothetical protein